MVQNIFLCSFYFLERLLITVKFPQQNTEVTILLLYSSSKQFLIVLEQGTPPLKHMIIYSCFMHFGSRRFIFHFALLCFQSKVHSAALQPISLDFYQSEGSVLKPPKHLFGENIPLSHSTWPFTHARMQPSSFVNAGKYLCMYEELFLPKAEEDTSEGLIHLIHQHRGV